MVTISNDDPVASAATAAVHAGDVGALRALLAEHPGLATARLRERAGDGTECARTLLHVVTDWPGHFPHGPATVVALVEAGADVDARFEGAHRETPLHWAASCDDVAVLDALLDAGADIDATGAVIGGGTPLSDATAFAQWDAAFRLVERGAATTLFTAATLGLQDRVTAYFAAPAPPPRDGVNAAFWGACHGGRLPTAQYLADQGADVNWIAPWEPATPLDAAQRTNPDADDLIGWLRARGGKPAVDLVS
ncbi:ankyrin repeat domain-containing protein [Actinophytocola sp. NPDC049390]|uniref:ankyrin repeat domain-containing protein n=1 Tax=Actinophytocola sp. NPDC049390 TaxID=3363894 RepID=UPI003798E48A